jgi:D-3-phosphoglycerate dehydrogenase
MAVIFFDFDSTVVKKETLDNAVAQALSAHPERDRLVREVEEITKLGMEGKINFMDSVLRRITTVPLSKKLLVSRGTHMLGEITAGIPEIFAWLREKGHTTHIVSGGFAESVEPVARKLALPDDRWHTNRFTFDANEFVSGVDQNSPLWSNDGKAPVLRALRTRYPAEVFVMVGDGYNDYRAYEGGAADIFIGFGANVIRESVLAQAPFFVKSTEELQEKLQILL